MTAMVMKQTYYQYRFYKTMYCTWKNVQQKATRVDLVTLYQNLNSGRRRMKGRNSSLALVGRPGPSSGSYFILKSRECNKIVLSHVGL